MFILQKVKYLFSYNRLSGFGSKPLFQKVKFYGKTNKKKNCIWIAIFKGKTLHRLFEERKSLPIELKQILL